MALVGLTSTATRTAFGTSSRNSPNRLARTSEVKKLMPVALPPGRARLATRPCATGSPLTPKAIGIRRGRSFGRKRRRIANRSDNADATADEVGHERRQAVVLAAEPAVLDGHVLALYVAGFGEAFTERACMAGGAIERPTADKADHRHCLLLRARREWPRRRCAADERHELAPLHRCYHSITS